MLDYFSSAPRSFNPFGARGIKAETACTSCADVDAFALELVNFLANPEAFIGMAETLANSWSDPILGMCLRISFMRK